LVAVSSSAEAAIGRCVAAISSATSGATSAANTSRNRSCWMYRSTPVAPSAPGNGTESSAGPSCPPGNLAASSAVLSPISKLKLATWTSAVTPGAPSVASFMTEPP